MERRGGMAWMFGPKEEVDDPSILPRDIQMVYEDPWKVLGVYQGAKPWEVRDAFRVMCCNMNPEFVSLRGPKNLTFKHVLLAFRLANGDLPSRTKVVLERLKDRDCFDRVTPMDVIPRLRPLKVPGATLHHNVRACKFLFIETRPTETTVEMGGTFTYFVFAVTYMLRSTTTRRRYQEFQNLHSKLKEEYTYLAELPDAGVTFSLGLCGAAKLAEALARYLLVCHRNLAARGFFSQRLMEFLGIDTARYHWEEEARIIKVLDTTTSIPGGHWQVVPEPWLASWRKFIQSRDARRYIPPGRLDNSIFFEEDGSIKSNLKLVQEYRVVNYNVWRYWELVYSAGPSICRRDRDIYSEPGIGLMQAVIMIQKVMRRAIARMRYAQKKLNIFCQTPGAREALLQVQLEERKKLAIERMQEARKARVQKNMEEAIKFTQETWRRKRGSVASRDALERQMHVQQVFRELSPHEDLAATMGKKFVVEQAVPIISIPLTEEYDVVFPVKLNIGLKKHPCTEITYVWNVQPPTDEEREAGSAPSRDVVEGSVVLAINGYPVSSMTHDQKMLRLKASSWPLRIRMRRPLTEGDVMAPLAIVGVDNETLRLHQLKRRLMVGIPVVKWGRQGSPHDSMLYLTETHLFWEGSERKTLGMGWTSEAVKAISLYELKYVLGGKQSAPFKRMSAARVKTSRCFTVFADDKELAIEIRPLSGSTTPRPRTPTSPDASVSQPPQAQQDDAVDLCNLLIWGFQRIIAESRSSLLYVDSEGNPVKRSKPKVVLKAMGELAAAT